MLCSLQIPWAIEIILWKPMSWMFIRIGKKTNPVLVKIFGYSPEFDATREKQYEDYCHRVCGGEHSNRITQILV